MGRIAKKSRGVNPSKGDKAAKKPLRYTIRKDSLDRRYAIDKRTGKRVSLSKAEDERKKHKKSIPVFRGIRRLGVVGEPQPSRAVKKTKKKVVQPKVTKKVVRKRAAPKKQVIRRRVPSVKKIFETARVGWKSHPIVWVKPIEKVIPFPEPPPPSAPITFEGLPPTLAELNGPYIPDEDRIHIVGGIADRSEKYPKVKWVADYSWINLQVEGFARDKALFEGKEIPQIVTPRFDRMYGAGAGEFVRSRYALARDLQDIDQIAHMLESDPDNPYDSIRELYTLYFSPELA